MTSERIDAGKTVLNASASPQICAGDMSSLFETACLVFRDFHESLADEKRERAEISAGLRDILTQNEHLRRKDFDLMMQGILSVQERREKEVKDLLDAYFTQQKQMARELQNTLDGVKDSLAKGEAQRIRDFQQLLKNILSREKERKDGITARLKEFQQEQRTLGSRLRSLLTKGRELRIRDLKSMLGEFKRKRLQTALERREMRESRTAAGHLISSN